MKWMKERSEVAGKLLQATIKSFPMSSRSQPLGRGLERAPRGMEARPHLPLLVGF